MPDALRWLQATANLNYFLSLYQKQQVIIALNQAVQCCTAWRCHQCRSAAQAIGRTLLSLPLLCRCAGQR